MKKMLSLLICVSLLTSPFQALAMTTNEALANKPESKRKMEEDENNTTPEDQALTAEVELDKINQSAGETSEPLYTNEQPSDDNNGLATETPPTTQDDKGRVKEALFNRQHTQAKVNEKADAQLVTQELMSLTGLIDEIIYEIALEIGVEYEDIELDEADYLEIAREILVSYVHYGDYLIATHQEIYTEPSLADLQSHLVITRQHLNANNVTLDSMETHFNHLQTQVIALEKIPTFTLDTSRLSRILTEISAANLNKKEFVLSIYTIFEEYYTLAKEMLAAINQGEIVPQSEVDTLTKQLELAYSSLVKKVPHTVPAMEAINLTLTHTSGHYPILAEATRQELKVRVYGDNGLFQTDGESRVALYINDYPIFEDIISHDEGLEFEMNYLNSLILAAKMEALGEGGMIPPLTFVTRDYRINVDDKRKIPTEIVKITTQDDHSEPMLLSGGNFGETHLMYAYDPEYESVSVGYYLGEVNEDEQPLETVELSLDEPVMVSIHKDGMEQMVRLIFQEESDVANPNPPIKLPGSQDDNKKPGDDRNKLAPIKQNEPVKEPLQKIVKNKNLPKTNEQMTNQFMYQLIGTFLIVIAIYRHYKRNDSSDTLN